MKTIIIPTDFSENAANALHYAAALATQNNSKLVLLHAMPLETLTSMEGSEVALPPDPGLEVYYLNKLVQFGKQIREEKGFAFEMEAVCVYGPLPDNLNKLVCSKQADLVVMGTKGARKLTDSWLGTNAFNYLRQAECPVLVIPQQATFQGIKRLAYASDFDTEEESVYLRQLLAFAEPFAPQTFIVNVKSDEQLRVVSDRKMLRNIKALYPDYPFCFAQVREDDVAAALQEFVKDNQIDILAIGIQKRIFLERIFHHSVSRDLAFHSSGPILALPPRPYRQTVKEAKEKPDERQFTGTIIC
jgi:nucleotide-binding universal stress UspA family protein